MCLFVYAVITAVLQFCSFAVLQFSNFAIKNSTDAGPSVSAFMNFVQTQGPASLLKYYNLN